MASPWLCECIVETGDLCSVCLEVSGYAARLTQEPGDRRFLDFLHNLHGRKLPSALANLLDFLKTYPRLCFVRVAHDGQFEVCFYRSEIVSALERDRPSFIFTSFERGMKHAKFYVYQSTHCGVVKVWRPSTPD